MSNAGEQDNMAVFISLVTESIKSSSGLAIKVDNLAETQKRQDIKLDGLLTMLGEVKALNNSLVQRVENTEKDTSDHEVRIRILEPVVTTLTTSTQEYRRRVEKLETADEAKEKSIEDINTKITRYVAIAGTALLVAQFFIATFVVPWAQQIFFGG